MVNLTVRQYADSLEELGYMALGEPCVYYQIKKGRESIRFYLDFDKHKTQVLLSGGHLDSDPAAMRDSIFNLNKLNKRYSLTDFVKEYHSKTLIAAQLEDLRRHGNVLGRSTNTKYLTYHLAHEILQNDILSDKNASHSRLSTKVLPELLQTYNSIGRPENLAYIARLSYLSNADKAEFVDLPLSYLARSFSPPSTYEYITLPRTVVNIAGKESIDPYSRQYVSIS